jgi:hypothetical protein
MALDQLIFCCNVNAVVPKRSIIIDLADANVNGN